MRETIITEGRRGRTLRRGLMSYGSAAALAAALFLADGEISDARAQSIGPRMTPNEAVQGNFTSPAPAPPQFESRSGTIDTIRLASDAVLNWTPYDTQPMGGSNGNSFVNFLPLGTELRFVGLGTDFTAINRVLTTANGAGAYRPIAIGGTVSSYLGTRQGGIGQQGGNIWFYSPGGILATGSAAFNVGGLLLSTSDIANFSRQNLYRSADFTGIAPSHPTATVTLAAGSQVNLPNPQSTLVIFSPTIEQGGVVTVNGSVSYLSGATGNLQLYDAGTIVTSITGDASAGNRIVHTGTTTGPASIGAPGGNPFDPQIIEFLGGTNVGVLLAGSIGYAPATNAQLLPNGSIALTAGSVTVTGDLTFGSDTTITAIGPVNLTAAAGTRIATGSDVNGGYLLQVHAPEATLRAEAGGTVALAGRLLMQHNGPPANLTLSAAPASGQLAAGSVTVGGDLVMWSGGGNVAVSGGETPLTVGGSANLEGQSIALSFAGGGGFEAADILMAATGGISLTRSGGAGSATLKSASGINLFAEGSISAGADTLIDAGGLLTLATVGGNIDVAALRTGSAANIVARGNVTLGDATVGTSTPSSLLIFAGLEDFGGTTGYHSDAVVRIDGDVSAGTTFIESGGFVRFTAGSTVRSDLFVRSGDDIVVESGASLIANPGPANFDKIVLQAGDIELGPFNGDLVAPITTPIASLVVRGSLDSSGTDILLSGDAIDAAAGTIVTGTIRADATDAPFIDPYSSDAGLLTPGCAQGSACIGTLTATGDVLIGLNSNADLVSATLGTVNFSGGSFQVTTRDGMAIGTPGSASQLAATSLIALTSLAGDIALRDASFAAPTLSISASQGSLIGNGNLSSANAIAVDVGTSLSAGIIQTGGALVRAFGNTGPYALSGDFSVARLETGGNVDLAILAGGNVTLGYADPNGARVVLTGKAVELGETSADTAAIDVDGETIRFGTLRALGAVNLTSSLGAITGDAPGSISAGTTLDLVARTDLAVAGALSAGTNATLTALEAMTLGQVTAGGGIELSAASLTANSLTAGAGLDFAINGLADVGSLTTGTGAFLRAGAITLDAAAIGGALDAVTSAGAFTGGNLTVGGDALISAAGAVSVDLLNAGAAIDIASTGAIELGSADAGTRLALSALSGSIGFDNLDAGTGLTLVARDTITGGDLAAGGAISATGASVALGAARFGSGLTLTALSGDLNASGLLQGTGPVTIDAARGLAIASADTVGAIGIRAGGDASFVELRSRDGAVTVAAAGALTGSTAAAPGADPAGDDSVSLTAGGALTLTGAVRVLNSASRAQDDFSAIAGGALAVTGAEAGRDLLLRAGLGSLSGSGLVAGRNLSLTAPRITLDTASVTGNLFAEATAGDIVASGSTSVGGAIDLIAAGAMSLQSLTAQGGGIAARASLDIAFTGMTAAGPIGLTAGGAITGGTLSANGTVEVDAGGPIALAGLTAPDAALFSTGGAINANGLAISGLLTARGTGVTLAAPGALTASAEATSGALAITTGGDLLVDGKATGAIALTSTGGSVTIGTVGQNLQNGGGIGPQSITGGADVAIQSAQAITVTDSVTAAGALTMTAGTLVTLNGPATGQTIAITAADLVIGANGTLGTGTTQRIALASAAPITLGTGATGGFAVDSAEFGRIRNGGDLLITALGSGGSGGNLSVRGLVIDAGTGGQIGAESSFTLTATGGTLAVTGDLSVNKGGANTGLSLKGDTVDLDYATAALAVLDSGGDPTGRMLVDGRIITSISAAARSDIVGKTPEQISLRLGQADVIRTTPLFRTSALTLTGFDAILIQNSGTGPDFGDRRGLTVGSLIVNGASDGHTLVIINGIVGNLTGIDAARIVQFTSPIAPGSTVNGCALGNLQGCAVADILAPQSILIGTPNLLQEEEEEPSEVEDGVADGKSDAPPIDTQKIDDPAGSPMIDDPVTGAGNEDLWQPPDD